MKTMILLLSFLLLSSFVFASQPAPPLPQTPRAWLDSRAMSWQDLRGKVVLLNVWTFACWNSYRSLPWIVSLREKFPDLQIIGIHSPEFDYEKNRNQMRETMARYHVNYPQVLDDNHEYWQSLNNTYWPAFYIVDKKGNLREKFAGETHPDDRQAAEIEKVIDTLSKETP
jgi:glutathione peroxidase-family protein